MRWWQEEEARMAGPSNTSGSGGGGGSGAGKGGKAKSGGKSAGAGAGAGAAAAAGGRPSSGTTPSKKKKDLAGALGTSPSTSASTNGGVNSDPSHGAGGSKPRDTPGAGARGGRGAARGGQARNVKPGRGGAAGAQSSAQSQISAQMAGVGSTGRHVNHNAAGHHGPSPSSAASPQNNPGKVSGFQSNAGNLGRAQPSEQRVTPTGPGFGGNVLAQHHGRAGNDLSNGLHGQPNSGGRNNGEADNKPSLAKHVGAAEFVPRGFGA
jgi:hypothetical protein